MRKVTWDDYGVPPLCFVVMPFGLKPDGHGGTVDFDAVYTTVIAPAVVTAGLQPLRADQELVGGLIHKPMFERLVLSEYAVADVTTANANVFYELGVRHAVRPYSTVLIGAKIGPIPFDLAPDRVLPYELNTAGKPSTPEIATDTIRAALFAARDAATDSPVFQLVDDLPVPHIDATKLKLFEAQARHTADVQEALRAATEAGPEALRRLEQRLEPLRDAETMLLLELQRSYRERELWAEMISLVERMPGPLARTPLVRERYAFALDRSGRSDDAERVLTEVLRDAGPRSETYGLLGGVYKRRWSAAATGPRAHGLLRRSIDAYRRGFEADWRDPYPGINLVTLLEIYHPGGQEQQRLVPVVRYAVERRISAGQPHYWDYATLVELAVLAREESDAAESEADALAAESEPWMLRSLAGNLALIRRGREAAGETIGWATAIEDNLRNTAAIGDARPVHHDKAT